MSRSTPLTALATLALGALVACEPSGPMTATPDSAANPPVPPSAPATAQPSAAPEAPAHNIPPSSPIAAAGPADSAVKANNAFGLALYQQLKSKPGNLTFSPASISVALAMTYAGAKGITRSEMERTLEIASAAGEFHSAWASQLSGWQGPTGADIAVANRLFGEKKYTFEAPYLSYTKTHYGAPLLPVDFAGAPEQQRLRINAWVTEQTRNRIQDLIPPRGVTNDTRMALVNAIYFKAKWNEPFPTAATQDDTFTTAAGTKVTTPMMSQTTSAQYSEVGGAQIMQLGYRGDRFATLFVLPPANQKLTDLESKLNGALLDRWTGALQGERTSIRLPKFKIAPTVTVKLKEPLKAMGMKQAFMRGGADFTGITNPANPEDRLFVEEVYHRAFVAMDEVGTEAAAATAVMMGRKGPASQQPKTFHADRPFLFFIRDTKTGMVMFAGRVADPTK